MEKANEITIRVSSPILFIDDDSMLPESSGDHHSYNSLTVVSKRSHSSDSSPMRSLSPKAPIAKEETQSESAGQRHLELIIKGEDTTIKIQTIRKAKKKGEQDDFYEFINESVQKIFSSPGREEIEKALETVGLRAGDGERKFTKKGTWKMLSRSAKESMQRQAQEQEERYPSIVLLQEPPEKKPEEEIFPKMVMVDNENIELKKPKFDFRSKSMFSLLSPSLNELHIEKHHIDIERSYLEREKRSLEEARFGLERGKTTIEREKKSLERSKSFLFEDQKMLNKKVQALREETGFHSRPTENSYKKEKLCMELEKQLLEDEKKLMTEEQTILEKEREIIEQEKTILGGEKNILEGERAIFGKETVLEKQHSVVSEKMLQPDEFRHSDEVLSEIEDVFEDACQLSNKHCRHQRLRSPNSVHSPLPNFSLNTLTPPYPLYVPVYNLHRPYMSSHTCCSNFKKTKNMQTQTDHAKEESLALPEPGLPFGLLSGIFPRVLITNMNGYQHGAEERADRVREAMREARNTQIREVSSEAEAAAREPTKIKRKPSKKLLTKAPSPKGQKRIVAGGKLQIPAQDVTLKASQSEPDKPVVDETETEAEESGIQTLTSETLLKDDTSGISDETISVETIHFGYCDDFYSNEAVFPKKVESTEKEEVNQKFDDRPLTNVGYNMFEKLTKLSFRDPPPEEVKCSTEQSFDCTNQRRINLHLDVECGDVQLALPGNIFMHVRATDGFSRKKQFTHFEGDADPLQEHGVAHEVGGGCLVKRADLWHTDAKQKLGQTQYGQGRAISLHLNNDSDLNLNLISNEKESVSHQQDTDISITLGNKKRTRDVKTGTDLAITQNLPTEVPRSKLSPRTGDLLDALRRKLEFAESEKNVVSFGKACSDGAKPWGDQQQHIPFNGLYFVKQFPIQSPTKEPKLYKAPSPKRVAPESTREYLCEECLTTMRLYDDEFQSVQNIVNKFENMSRFG